LLAYSFRTGVTQSYATGNVTGSVNNVGGLVGLADTGSNISKSYATGAVNAPDTVGGLVGWLFGAQVSQSYSSGRVTGNTNVGASVGFMQNAGSITQSYWDSTVNGSLAGLGGAVNGTFGATGLTTGQFYNPANFSGWNFGTTPIGSANTCAAACWVVVG